MTLYTQVINKLILGNKDFCCMCLQDTKEKEIRFFDEEIPLTGGKTLTHILSTICGEEVTQIFSFGSICEQCKVTAICSYQFIQMCRDRSKTIKHTVHSILESTKYIDENLFLNYKSLFINIDSKYVPWHYYDEETTTKDNALHQFRYLSVDVPITLVDEAKKATKSRIKETRRRLYYDIPTIPTTELISGRKSNRIYKCKHFTICHKSFSEEVKLRTHYFKKHHPREFKCNHCSKEFITEDHLKIHSEQYHSKTVCSKCGKSFTNKYVLKKHEAYHNFSIECELCNRVYHSYEAYKKHKKEDICSQKIRKTASQGTFFCHYCHKSYCHKPYLARHIKYEHENAIGFQCKHCNKQFYCKSGLEAHLVKHTLVKKFECNTCGKKFGSKMSLLYHTRLHTGEKPYKCEHCDQAFLSASRRLEHTKRLHLLASFKCEICNTKFKSTITLMRHKKRHGFQNKVSLK